MGVVGTYSRKSANRGVAEADLVVFIGTETGSMTTNFWKAPSPRVSAIRIDIEPEALGRNYRLEVALLGDARTTLERLTEVA